MRAPTAAQWADMCGELVSTAKRLAAEGPELMRRASSAPAGDGYPTSSMGGGRSTSVSDPVGQLVARMDEHTQADPVATGVAQMLSATSNAVAALRLADAARAKASLPAPAPAGEPGVKGCVVHALYGLHEPARARGRCRWCGDWAHSHDFADPPESAIRALEDERIRRELDSAAA